ncbi:hypothetical protein COS55_01115 [Candidatus Shapirobacteria bacterium CG03_land_8_20_14_0_80_40_19]|uniref:PIN domain-containing protein n=4 Tax=Candidatus Shapironibacteriota TaxID=1752721 RepID=A0A2M7BF81_9BACT|nr:MAG: hypothetical protein COV89_02355 [Candidatus Shapirobacteria bacterium CG11_big_fil_rev_8_21_14_0_20_40_12]PIV01744.1 MAG: hypothetical protein COS55_01115 [Candidatus Shapirobacteria bacterium CG03_land_8_20_14_0_80_40_19]PJC28642.1 MAG: hypothetical protein CO053_03585 [Candidatus Shapirobacteria bacterium CG_4_9_14_0_2_um_filter_40_11]PJC77200.1 MAG: hypothetical protein CO010_00870 [Candidatus Shapirobacteria bacterium CG_4_8_14_3_um_filter_39_11]
MTYFFDASFLIALFNSEDLFHSKAAEIIKNAEPHSPFFITSNIAVAETVNALFRANGVIVTKKFISSFKKSNIEEFFVTKEIFSLSYKLLFQQKSKNKLNLFDCLHLETMKHLKVDTIFTFDSDFKNFVKINEIDT